MQVIWDIYYHFYLNAEELKVLNDQAERLLKHSTSLDTWNSGPYGRMIRFCDSHTLQHVKTVWQSCCVLDQSKAAKNVLAHTLSARIQTARDLSKAVLGDGINMTAVRAAAPVGVKALSESFDVSKHFWRHGVLSTSSTVLQSATHPNPTLGCPLHNSRTLHYGSNPLLGFHLAASYASFSIGSPFHHKQAGSNSVDELARTARSQMQVWAYAFKSKISHIILRFLLSDAVTACRMLLEQKERSAQTSDLVKLETPEAFNVIDSSNLADSVGLLNLLLVTKPLLEITRDATIYTEFLARQDSGISSTVGSALRGDLATISLLLDLYPAEWWSNASMISPEDAIIHSIMQRVELIKVSHSGQLHCRMSWKSSPATWNSAGCQNLTIASEKLAPLLFSVYLKMMAHEDVSQQLGYIAVQQKALPTRFLLPQYHRGSFAFFIAFLKRRVSSDWHLTVRELLRLIEEDNQLIVGSNYAQELFVHLHLLGIFSVSRLVDEKQWPGDPLAAKSLYSCGNLPPVLYVTLKVPRSKLSIFEDIESSPKDLGTPLVHACIQSQTWQNLFAAIRLTFGTPMITEVASGIYNSLGINADIAAWDGSSPLLVSFPVPTWILLQEPHKARVSLGMPSTVENTRRFVHKLGLTMMIFEARQDAEDNVYISKNPPQLSVAGPGTFVVGGLSTYSPQTASDTFKPSSTIVGLDSQSRLSAVTVRASVEPQKGLTELRDGAQVKTEQADPFAIRASIVSETSTHTFELRYPIPVSQDCTKTRIARTSGYIEVVALLDKYRNAKERQDDLLELVHGFQGPTTWNFPRLNCDLQPILDTQKDLQWLITHMSFQMSDAERRLRERYLHSLEICPSVRVNFKDSIFSMFMHFTGLQGRKAESFGLSIPDAGGIHVLVLASKLRLDLGNHTVFLDAAILPLAPSTMSQFKPFLQAISTKALVQIKVDADELKLWHQMLRIYVERCRTWTHRPTCEYNSQRNKQTTWKQDSDPLCSCGRGFFPSDYFKGVPNWNVAKKYAVRAAISPLYAVPYVDPILSGNHISERTGDASMCANCKSEQSSSVKLSSCARCKKVKYCSKECQKNHWPKHKISCKTSKCEDTRRVLNDMNDTWRLPTRSWSSGSGETRD